jgi:hypothetical protein
VLVSFVVSHEGVEHIGCNKSASVFSTPAEGKASAAKVQEGGGAHR